MQRFLVEFRMKNDDEFQAMMKAEEAFVSGGKVWVFAETITDAAWQVKFMISSHVDVYSVKAD